MSPLVIGIKCLLLLHVNVFTINHAKTGHNSLNIINNVIFIVTVPNDTVSHGVNLTFQFQNYSLKLIRKSIQQLGAEA